MKYKLTLLFCLLYASVFAQIKLHGKVTDSKGTPIFAANIYLTSQTEVGTSSDFDGNFHLTTPSMQEINLTFSFIGYQTKTVKLTKAMAQQPIIVKLKEDKQLLSEVIVTAKDPISEKFSVTKIRQLDIYFNPVSNGDALKAITLMPASTTTDETANPSLRGSSPDRSRITLNGVPVYTPVRSSNLSNQGKFSLFNTGIINKQYVYASNPPLTYGNSSAGLVEIQTLRRLPQNQQQFSLSLGSVGFFLSQQLQKKEENFVQLYGNYHFSKLFTDIQKKYVPRLKSFHTKDLGANFHFKLGKNFEINSFNYAIKEGFDVNNPSLNYEGQAKSDKKRLFSINTFNYYTTKGILSLNTGINTSQQDFHFGNIKSDKTVQQGYASLNFRSKITQKTTLQTGLTYEYHRNRFNDTIPKYYFAMQPEAPTQISKATIENHLAEAYLYSDFEFSKKLSFSAGIRGNLPIKNKASYLNAQIGAKYQINKKHSLLVSMGKYHSYTTPNYYNKQFTALSSQQYACDYKYIGKRFGAKVAVYHKIEDGKQQQNAYFAIDKVKTTGLETFITYNFAKFFKITASNLFINQKYEEKNLDFHGKYDFDYFVKFALQYSSLKWFTASISYIGHPGSYYTPIREVLHQPNFDYPIPIFSENPNSAQFDSYNKIDFTINRYTPLPNGGVIIPFLSINNIFNIQNDGYVYYNSDFSEKYFDSYGKRIFYFGVIWQL